MNKLSLLSRSIVESKFPEFTKTVKGLRGKHDCRVLMTIEAFGADPELLYEALCYSRDEGVSVEFVPQRTLIAAMPKITNAGGSING